MKHKIFSCMSTSDIYNHQQKMLLLHLHIDVLIVLNHIFIFGSFIFKNKRMFLKIKVFLVVWVSCKSYVCLYTSHTDSTWLRGLIQFIQWHQSVTQWNMGSHFWLYTLQYGAKRSLLPPQPGLKISLKPVKHLKQHGLKKLSSVLAFHIREKLTS